MLTRLYIDNFRCFVNFEFRLRPKQLLMGSNGSGKSSLMDALLLIRRVASIGDTLQDLETLGQRTRWRDHSRQSWEMEALLGGQTYVYRLVIEPWGSPPFPRVVSEAVHLDGKPVFEFIEGEVHLFNDRFEHKVTYPFDFRRSALATITERKDNTKLTRFQRWLRSLVGFRIDPFRMAPEAEQEDPEPKLDLSNFSSWYRSLVQENPRQDDALLASLRSVIDGFDYLKFEPAGRAKTLQAEFVGGPDGHISFDLSELSEGQRCLMSLYAVLHFVLFKGGTVILDEPDNFLSLREIQPWLMAATDAVDTSGGQLLLISHHPEILNQWAPECGVRLFRDGTGPVRVEDFHRPPESPLTPAEIVARGWENE